MREHSIVNCILDNISNHPNIKAMNDLIVKLYPHAEEHQKEAAALREQLIIRLGDNEMLDDYESELNLLDALHSDVIYLRGIADGLGLAELFKSLRGA